jgi:crotonobetainyl-CoA:carnitine CoA-transferase CaiB-like acyl-CoA transferase
VTESLAGIGVVTTAVNVPGPVAAGMLRDMGATIVKVEPPKGDPLSVFAPAWYASLSAGMEVLRLDLKSDRARDRFDDLLSRADVLVTASRPASLHRLGLAWPDLHRRHPRLCHVAIVGYAAPRQDVAGHDVTYQAEVGLVTPSAMPQSLIADLAGAHGAVIAALDLLFARERRGEAGCVQIALAECARLFAAPLRYGLTSSTGPLGGTDPAYNIYRTREGWVAVAALEPDLRAALANELSVDVEDGAALAQVLLQRSALEWERWADTRGLPLAAVRE